MSVYVLSDDLLAVDMRPQRFLDGHRINRSVEPMVLECMPAVGADVGGMEGPIPDWSLTRTEVLAVEFDDVFISGELDPVYLVPCASAGIIIGTWTISTDIEDHGRYMLRCLYIILDKNKSQEHDWLFKGG